MQVVEKNFGYVPRKDIPIAVRELKTFSPSRIRDWIREHKTKKDRVTGKRVQVLRSPDSIGKWLKRHPRLLEELKNEVTETELEQETISETLFYNGAFRKIPCIEQMIIDMRGRGAKDLSINTVVGMIKRVCMGQLPQTKEQRKNGEAPQLIEDWGLKHPRRLTVDDCLKFNSEMIKHKVGDRDWRLAMRCFLKSMGLRGWDKLSGKYGGAGKYAHLYIPPEKKEAIFLWLDRMNKEAHDAVYFAFKTGCRTGGTLGAETKYVDKETHTIYVFEKASKHSPKRKLKKKIPQDLWKLLEPRIQNGGKLFNIEENEITALLKACYQEIIPELAQEIPMPFHFWRHQFAQYGLRATGWNTSLIAKLGGWTVGTLERYYGKMDEQTAYKEAEKFLPFI
jgi:Phage integrase family.